MQRRRGALSIVLAILAVQVATAVIAYADVRPARFGWQMYSALPTNVTAWSIHGDEERELDVEAALVHSRAEINRAVLVREHGCRLVDADAIRIELPDGTTETIRCR